MEIESQHKMYEVLINTCNDVILILSPNNKFLYISGGIARVLGYHQKEANHLQLKDLFHPEDWMEVEDSIKKVKEQENGSIGMDCRIKHKEDFWIDVELVILNQFENPVIKGLVLNFKDLRDRQKAKLKLKAINHQLEERVKEQKCLYQITKLTNHNIPVEELLKEVVNIIPTGWQFDSLASAEITYGDINFKSESFSPSKCVLSNGKVADSGKELQINVYYSDQFKKDDHQVFLDEEVKLLDSICDHLIQTINRLDAVKKLIKNEERLNKILNSEPECVKVVSADGQLIDMNKAGLEMIEADASMSQIKGLPIKKLIHPDDYDVYLQFHQTVLKGRKENAKFKIIGFKGTTRWMESTAVPLENEDGAIDAVLSITRDISEKVISKMKLKETRKQFQSILESINGIVWEVDAITFETKFVSPQAEKILGYPMGDWVNIHEFWQNHMHPDDKEKTIAFSKKQTERGIDYNIEYRMIAKGGSIVWVHDFVTVVKYENQPTLLRGILVDITKNKEIELERLKIQSELEQIYNQSLDIICTLDAKGTFVKVSLAAKDIWGYDPQRIIGKNQLELIHPEDIDKTVKNTEEVLSGISHTNFENRYIDDKGNIVPMFWSVKWDAGDNLIYAVGRDGRAYKKAQTEKSILINNTDEAFVLTDTNLRIVSFNNQFKSMYKKYYGREIMAKTPILDYADPSRLDMLVGLYERVLEGNVEKSQIEVPLPDGTKKHFRIIYKPGYDEDGNIFGVFVTISDVTERELIFRELAQSNERFEKVKEATNDAIWDWNISSDFLYRTAGFSAHFVDEDTPSGITIASLHKVIHEEDIEGVYNSLQSVILNPEKNNWQREYRYMRKDGTYAFVNDRGVVIRDEDGKAIRMVGAMTDVSYQKEYEDSLKKLNKELEDRANALAISNKELEQFAYVASHDLQEPLRMVSSFLTQLEKKYADTLDDRAKQYIHFAVDGAKRMRQIILDILDFSRVGRSNEKREKVDLNELVNEILFLYNKQIEELKATIAVQKLPHLYIQKTPIRQVFQNLISNGLKYQKADTSPKLRIRATEYEDHWQFSIQDNGIGIHPDFFDKVFVIFQRLHLKGEYSGTGMGLAVTKKIIENNGGKIWLESGEEGGCTFYFTIPKKPEIAEIGI